MTKKMDKMQPATEKRPNLSHFSHYGMSMTSIKRAERMVEKVICPSCGYTFSKLYARAISCQGCIKAARGCRQIRCPKCDNEFDIGRTLDFYADLHRKYYEAMGWSLSR